MNLIKFRKGFTLIELLVVIAIIAILIGLLLPAVQKVRESSAKMSCTNNIKQIALALHGYHDRALQFPPGCTPDLAPNAASWGSSWKVFILPNIEQNGIFSNWQFTGSSGAFNANNQSYVNNSKVTIKTYRCPSSLLPAYETSNNKQMFTSYVGIAGSVLTAMNGGNHGQVSGGGILFPNSAITLSGIPDGTSNTIMVGEQSDHLRDAAGLPTIGGAGAITSQGPWGWTMGCNNDTRVPPNYQSGGDNRAFQTSTTRWSINQRGLGNTSGNGTNEDAGVNVPLSSGHTGGVNVAMADGSVKFISQNIPLLTLQYLSDRADGNVVSSYD
ncbi:MAG: DUF1559 domain-containing protein [Planctomycetota bacterium]